MGADRLTGRTCYHPNTPSPNTPRLDMIDAVQCLLGHGEPVAARQLVSQGGIRVDTRVAIHELLAGYRAGRLSRRDLLIRSAALGVSATALGELLAREAAAAPLA